MRLSWGGAFGASWYSAGGEGHHAKPVAEKSACGRPLSSSSRNMQPNASQIVGVCSGAEIAALLGTTKNMAFANFAGRPFATKTRAQTCTVACCAASSPLILRKTSIGSGRLSRHTFSTTLGSISEAMPPELVGRLDTPLSVLVETKRERAGDLHLRATVKTALNGQCDRCGENFQLEVEDGSFEIWLASSPDLVPSCGESDERTEEAVEDWRPAVKQLDLSPHTVDAILLGRPLKALCGACRDEESTLPDVIDDDEESLDVPEELVAETKSVAPPTLSDLEKLKKALDRRSKS